MEDIRRYDRFIWHLIGKIRTWGYELTKEDTEDLFQDGYLSAWEARNLDINSILKYIRRGVFSSFHYNIRRFGQRSGPPDYAEPFVNPQTPEDVIVEKEHIERNFYGIKNSLSQEELSQINELLEHKTLVSMNIQDSDFSDIRAKLAYLRIFKDHVLLPDERETAKIYTEVLLGMRSRFPKKFRQKHTPFLIRYLFDKILEKDPSEVDKPYTEILKRYKLGEVHQIMENLKRAYPGKQPWEFRNVRWSDDMVLAAIDYVADKEDLPRAGIRRGLLLKYKKIDSVIHNRFGGLSNLFKGILTKEEQTFARIDKKWFGPESDEYAHCGMDYLVRKLKEDYNVGVDDIPIFFRKFGNKISEYKGRKIFEQYGLGTMLNYKFNWSIWRAFDFHFPKRFYPWEFGARSYKDWDMKNKENAAKATRWFVKQILNLENPQGVVNYKKSYIIRKMKENGIGNVASSFHKSLYRIFNNAYPGLFKPADFRKKKTLSK